MRAKRIPVQVAWSICLTVWIGSGCGDSPTRIGQACQTDAHCGQEAGIALICDHSIPGGSCTAYDCAFDDPTTCPPGSLCAQTRAGTACRQTCQLVLDCRAVIVCQPDPDCDPEQADCATQCDNEMTCVPADPAVNANDPDADRVCQLRGN